MERSSASVVTADDPSGPPPDQTRFAWQRRLKANPLTRRIYRLAVGVVGTAIVLVGIVLLPAPGPGWLIIFAGLAVLASEFAWAQRLLVWTRARVHEWTEWTKRQNAVVRALVVLAIVAVVLLVFWALFAISGVPQWLPDVVRTPLQTYVPGL